ncbi:DNA-3-methyladenine glycosylase II [Breoghania corrubedonensis]|uniref:DNA-3-methyladenine glycosylase II n=1 Tax=Breoghania corrubedonensis TaxID=665038 RepID=A0A2T5VHT1_9HYPH|nr:DNA-3-methyladenine glycosylase II [Breoghania corrubedonensis]
MKTIATEADIRKGLDALLAIDARLKPIADVAGPLPLRRRPADLKGLAHIVVGQQVSIASAAAIFSRLEALVDPFDAATLSAHDDTALAVAGLSRPKIRTLRAICAAMDDGLDLAGLADASATEAHSRLCAIPGIGPWSADIFLLFCAGHADIFPTGDLALREALRVAFGLDTRPAIKEVAVMALAWQPWRGIAARLFWAYYRTLRKGRDVFPI